MPAGLVHRIRDKTSAKPVPDAVGATATRKDRLRAALGLQSLAAGVCSLSSRDVHGLGPAEKARLVGYLPGELPIYPDLTGHGFLRFLTAVGRRPVAASRLEWLLAG